MVYCIGEDNIFIRESECYSINCLEEYIAIAAKGVPCRTHEERQDRMKIKVKLSLCFN
jgi:hypothetical protein